MAIGENAAPVRHGTRWRGWLIALVCAAVLAWPAAAFFRQYRQYFAMRAENGKLQHEILRLKAEQQQLRKVQATLLTPEGMEREARRLGYLRPGEARLSVPE